MAFLQTEQAISCIQVQENHSFRIIHFESFKMNIFYSICHSRRHKQEKAAP